MSFMLKARLLRIECLWVHSIAKSVLIITILDDATRICPESFQFALEFLGGFDPCLLKHLLGIQADIPGILVKTIRLSCLGVIGRKAIRS